MKVLLLNMPIHFNSWQNLEMPLGILYIASELERHGHTVSMRDYEVEHFNESEFSWYLDKFHPDVVGISFRSSSYVSAKKISILIKNTNLDIKVVLGGHHATAFAKETLKDMAADFVIRGEGEYIMPELLDALERKSDLSKIEGLTYYKDGFLVDNMPAGMIKDLDLLSFPAWHLLNMDKYVTGSILTSRGCPFGCIYCDKGVSTRKVRFRSPQNIYNEMKIFEEKYKKGRLYFIDDYFLLNKKRLSELFSLVSNDKDFKIRWYCQARVDGLDEELLKNAKKTGCEMIIFGVETGDPKELEYINKNATLEDAMRAMELTKKARIRSRANFMIGFPMSTHETVSNSIRFARKINADLYRFFIVSPLPNTILWDRVQQMHPEIADVSWDKFDFYSPSFDTAGMKKEDLVKYVLVAYLYVLKDKVLWELTLGFFPRFIRLVARFIKNRRLRGNLSVVFPACVNLFLEGWFILRNLPAEKRLSCIKGIVKLERKLNKNVN